MSEFTDREKIIAASYFMSYTSPLVLMFSEPRPEEMDLEQYQEAIKEGMYSMSHMVFPSKEEFRNYLIEVHHFLVKMTDKSVSDQVESEIDRIVRGAKNG